MRRVSCAVALATALGGCASAPVKAPPVQTYQLGSLQAEYRDYRGGDICAAEPRWLADELRAPLAIVGRFASLVGADPDGAWSAEDIALVSDGAATLLPLLDVLEANLERVRSCSFVHNAVYVEILRDGSERCAAARRGIPNVAKLVEYIGAKAAREAWRKDGAQRAADARTRCGEVAEARPPQACQSVVECDGSQAWLFTDGSRLTRSQDNSFEWIPVNPPAAVPRKKKDKRKPAPLTQDDYIAATRSFTEASRCPALPERPSPSAGFTARYW